jgi:hypothetical protein
LFTETFKGGAPEFILSNLNFEQMAPPPLGPSVYMSLHGFFSLADLKDASDESFKTYSGFCVNGNLRGVVI